MTERQHSRLFLGLAAGLVIIVAIEIRRRRYEAVVWGPCAVERCSCRRPAGEGLP